MRHMCAASLLSSNHYFYARSRLCSAEKHFKTRYLDSKRILSNCSDTLSRGARFLKEEGNIFEFLDKIEYSIFDSKSRSFSYVLSQVGERVSVDEVYPRLENEEELNTIEEIDEFLKILDFELSEAIVSYSQSACVLFSEDSEPYFSHLLQIDEGANPCVVSSSHKDMPFDDINIPLGLGKSFEASVFPVTQIESLCALLPIALPGTSTTSPNADHSFDPKQYQ
mmetsp:Transcript_25907/g.35760  ORF Transcript_25907/g.35760 Transcript_25907/m.35760 type:complete len:224 (+) Transcript_25907:163-834(+)